MKTIYRYEIEGEINYRGIAINPGPYISNHGADKLFGEQGKETYYKLYESMCKSHNNSKRHPIKEDDGLIGGTKEYCACTTITDLKTWFKGYNKRILDLGFKLVEYKVKYYIMGISGYQCGFKHIDVISKRIVN